MQIRNLDSQVSLEIKYGNDFEFTGNDKINRIFYEPIIIRGRSGGSYLNTSQSGINIWHAISRICFDKDPEQKGNIELLQGINQINGDKNDWRKTTEIKCGIHEGGKLLFGIMAAEDTNPEKKKKVELIISQTGEQASGILIVSKRQFQQFLELALAIQSFALVQRN